MKRATPACKHNSNVLTFPKKCARPKRQAPEQAAYKIEVMRHDFGVSYEIEGIADNRQSKCAVADHLEAIARSLRV